MIPERRETTEVSSTIAPNDSLEIVFRPQGREKEFKKNPVGDFFSFSVEDAESSV